jgi:hypothetical protein
MARKSSAAARVTPIAASIVQPPVIAPPAVLRKLDLGAGQNPRAGFESVDLLAPSAQHRVDLFKFPWPWEDSSVEELHASHFVEHIPDRDVEERDLSRDNPMIRDRFVGQDMAFAFFDECWRILRPGGVLTVIVPALSGDRAFQDPTHRRFIPAVWFAYFSAEWRAAQRLDHYRVRCDFGVNVQHTCDPLMNTLSPEAQARRFTESRNTIYDFHATMIAKKPAAGS